MELSDINIREYTKRILLSRLRLLCNNGFFGMLLMHMRFGLDCDCETAYTNGKKICFSPQFLDKLSDGELDFIMMHEVMHVALKHCLRGKNYEPERFNIACDIVVNSNILLSNHMDEKSITLKEYGVSMHTAPDGKEGYVYTAEQVYAMLPSTPVVLKKLIKNDGDIWDDHEKWEEDSMDDYEKQEWDQWVRTACEVISIRESSKTFGGPPMMAQRLMKHINKSQIDWRTILNEFVQQEINDYSFSPPDRRFDDSPFFLPDFNEKDEKVQNIWFLIDTSGSISDDAINAAYAEIRSAIEQFNGKLEGLLSFTESFVTDPIPFSNVEELTAIKPIGGGGNDFSAIFKYMKNNMSDNLPSQIIIITDGYDSFPKESETMGIPVLWLINNEDATPPWGKVARIKV